jgi:3-hydroxymyristoyl/3-hydroxydecanoyl-(acyl carrier protein) dehydratase
MRYVLLDRIVDLDQPRSIRALKCIRADDELIVHHAPGLSAWPASMLFEAMAQAAGLLVIAALGFDRQPVLAKLQPGETMGLAQPGDEVAVTARVITLRDAGCVAYATAAIADRSVAMAQIYLGLVPHTGPDASSRASALAAHLDATFPGWFGVARRREEPR